jgi:hypothetical protein
MHSNSWFDRFWTRVKAEVIQDVPPSLEECESCREVNCTQERWLTCARRLAAEAEAQPRDIGDFFTPSVTGRTDEMPGIYAMDSSQNQTTEDRTTESGDHCKIGSSSSD